MFNVTFFQGHLRYQHLVLLFQFRFVLVILCDARSIEDITILVNLNVNLTKRIEEK